MKRSIEKIEYEQVRVIRDRNVWQSSSRGGRHHYTMASLLVLVLKKAH